MPTQPKGVRYGGRQKGTPNKFGANLKEAILQAAQDAHADGVVGYLRTQANENPVAFMGLLGKVLPMQIQGDAQNPLTVTHIVIEAAAHEGDDQAAS